MTTFLRPISMFSQLLSSLLKLAIKFGSEQK